MPEGNGNSRVTMARLDERMKALGDKLDLYHVQVCGEISSLRAVHSDDVADHEKRLRELEGGQRRGGWLDFGAFVTAVVAGVTGVFVKGP